MPIKPRFSQSPLADNPQPSKQTPTHRLYGKDSRTCESQNTGKKIRSRGVKVLIQHVRSSEDWGYSELPSISSMRGRFKSS
ncbi:MAG: hypothetical protein ABI618_19520, partial [Nitrospirota bacterium]